MATPKPATSWSASSPTSTNGKAASTTTSPTQIVTVLSDDDGKQYAWHAFHSVGRNELAKQRPVVGDRIGFADDNTPEGKNYESYRVIVERADGEPKTIDWDKHAQPDDETDDQETELDDETPRPGPGR